jgi:hypothetical protein
MIRHPHYSLVDIQALMKSAEGSYRITRAARDGAAELKLDEHDVIACVCELSDGEFYKSMPADRSPGNWQDVYRTTYLGRPVYLKLQIVQVSARSAVVISFKRDESR